MNIVPMIQYCPTVIVANGAFPQHEIPLNLLRQAERIICCDGSTDSLLKSGFEPDFIVGDLDSLSSELKEKYAHALFHDPNQENNDLTKAVEFAFENGWDHIGIIGATGKREDHTLGNISLLIDYVRMGKIVMFTDYGVFTPLTVSEVFESFPGQQVSLFSLTPQTQFTTIGLKYSLRERRLASWWQGTLNEAEKKTFEVKIDWGEVIVFRTYSAKSQH